MSEWTDVAVRARGLATHLIGRPQLAQLATVRPLPALAAAIAERAPEVAPFLPADASDATALERATRRAAAARLRVLRRWATGGRARDLAVMLDDEDRRSLRAIVRGALGGVPAESRLAALIPTPALPERALALLARQPTVGAIAALLRAWGSSYGNALQPEAERPHPDPYLVQVALDREFARRGLRASRGSMALRRFVRLRIDGENAVTAVTLAGGSLGGHVAELFVDGGRWIDRALFVRAASAALPEDAVVRLAAGLVGSPLARQLPAATRWWTIDDAVLRGLVRHYRARARAHPVSSADVILYVLRLRAELRDLARLIWGAALGAPPAQVAGELVSC